MGGHPVPEANIRGRYERNGPLIRQAALMAERAFVFDNSIDGSPPRLLITFEQGHVIQAADDLPAWALQLYQTDLPG
jgi:predicted ABC-type ATPase